MGAIWILIWLALAGNTWAQPALPRPEGLVNDFAGVLTARYEEKIGAVAGELLRKTGVPIVVVTMAEIGGADYNDYANRLYNAWGIGKRGNDRGVLIFLTLKERKMQIETGYGTEGILPDGKVGEIRDQYMLPYLREDNFDEGIFRGVVALADVIAADAGVALTGQAPPSRLPEKRRGVTFAPFIALIVLLMMFSRRRGGSWIWALPLLMGSAGRSSHGGGGFSGGFGGFGGGMSGGGGAGGSF